MSMLKFRFFSIRTKIIFFKNSIRDHSLFMPGAGLAKMRGGPRQIQDSQMGGGGGVIIVNKSAHREEGLPDFLFLFYFQTNTFSALGTNSTWFVSLRKANSS